MKIVLIGNYDLDRQESMQRFATLLHEHLSQRGISVELIKPRAVLGRFGERWPWLSKWAGYVDKFFLFSLKLRTSYSRCSSASGGLVFHICDHSNSPYVDALPRSRVVATCHDLLAVRSALGEFPENPTARLGRELQRRILKGLERCSHVACVSQATRDDFLRLSGQSGRCAPVVHNGLNYPYRRMEGLEANVHIAKALADAGVIQEGLGVLGEKSFILHVGGNQWYKNRSGVLHIYRRLTGLMPDAPELVIVGKPLTDTHRNWIRSASLTKRVISVPGPDNETLRAFYSRARLLLFPSLAEGFGWPILEAQACGCPVVASQYPPMPEIGGKQESYCNPRNFRGTAAIIRRLLSGNGRAGLGSSEAMRSNRERFTTEAMIQGYVDIYSRVLAN
jgi:glycosyltransferase involved in cell wall biosynthesis